MSGYMAVLICVCIPTLSDPLWWFGRCLCPYLRWDADRSLIVQVLRDLGCTMEKLPPLFIKIRSTRWLFMVHCSKVIALITTGAFDWIKDGRSCRLSLQADLGLRLTGFAQVLLESRSPSFSARQQLVLLKFQASVFFWFWQTQDLAVCLPTSLHLRGSVLVSDYRLSFRRESGNSFVHDTDNVEPPLHALWQVSPTDMIMIWGDSMEIQ